jgi:hypothetical protein
MNISKLIKLYYSWLLQVKIEFNRKAIFRQGGRFSVQPNPFNPHFPDNKVTNELNFDSMELMEITQASFDHLISIIL